MEDLKALRHYLHQHPEVSQNEHKTQKYLLDLLGKLNTDKIEKTASTGILVSFKGKSPGKNILLRADIDALPIQETITTDYKSQTDGVSHKCGHDGHATIMYGVANHYSEKRPEKGDIHLLFQPAEENGWGARNVVADKTLENLNIDMVFALHNLPGFDTHNIVCKKGSFTSSVVSLVAYFKGYTAHAAEPWNGRNPAKAMSQYLLKALELNSENKPEYVTVTPVHTEMGEVAYGISAGEGSVHLTVRADSNERLNNALETMKSTAKEICKDEELEVRFELIEPFESNQNNKDAVAVIKNATEAAGFTYQEIENGFRFGEDFGIFTNIYPGAMFGIGSGKNCYPLHHPAYDYPDEITDTGIKMFTTIQEQAQQ